MICSINTGYVYSEKHQSGEVGLEYEHLNHDHDLGLTLAYEHEFTGGCEHHSADVYVAGVLYRKNHVRYLLGAGLADNTCEQGGLIRVGLGYEYELGDHSDFVIVPSLYVDEAFGHIQYTSLVGLGYHF